MIVICGLNDKLNFQVGKMLSDSLDMFFLELERYIEYDVINRQDIIDKVSASYLDKLEKKSVENAASFQNTVVAASYNSFAINENFNLFKPNSIIIYLRQTKNQLNQQSNIDDALNLINFIERDKKLKQISDHIITLEKFDQINEWYNLIIKHLKEVFL